MSIKFKKKKIDGEIYLSAIIYLLMLNINFFCFKNVKF